MKDATLMQQSPKVAPALDAAFRPAALAHRAFAAQATVPARLALEQADGSVFHFPTTIFPENTAGAADNFFYVERLVKFLLWSRGGFRVYFDGPDTLGRRLQKY